MSTSTLTPLVVLLLVLVGAMIIGAIVYLSHRHPRLSQPLNNGGAWAAVLVAAVALVLAAR
ncbi:hypothetical protein ABT117_33035 [Streptomyces sp. NPDC002262]|uniref:hypothetical protein n=1 Tax=Streptomyces sp. NPDC002262 TaxID=3154414 RepID=UPI0033227D07